MTTHRDEEIRAWMRRHWGGRTRHYAAHSAPRNRPFAAELVRRAAVAPGDRVLDIACGSGVVALAAAAFVGPTGSVLATDRAPEGGELVAEEAAAAGFATVAFRAMGAETLDLPDGGFDVALCQFGLMYVPDPGRALAEMRRVLRPGGRVGIAVWSTPDKVLHHLITQRIEAALPPFPLDERLPSPTELSAPGLIERLVEAAGFDHVVATRQTHGVPIDDPAAEWTARITPPSSLAARVAALDPADLEQLRQDTIAALAPYRDADGYLVPSEAIFAIAIARP